MFLWLESVGPSMFGNWFNYPISPLSALNTALLFLQRGTISKGNRTESLISAHDLAVQSQALLNVKDSNKVPRLLINLQTWSCNSICFSFSFDWLVHLQEERERIIVRKFKFEEPRIEQIQDLEVWIWLCCVVVLVEWILFCILISKGLNIISNWKPLL